MLQIATKIGVYIDDRTCRRLIFDCCVTSCYTISIASKRFNNQTNEAVNVMLQVATQFQLRINDLITKQTRL